MKCRTAIAGAVGIAVCVGLVCLAWPADSSPATREPAGDQQWLAGATAPVPAAVPHVAEPQAEAQRTPVESRDCLLRVTVESGGRAQANVPLTLRVDHQGWTSSVGRSTNESGIAEEEVSRGATVSVSLGLLERRVLCDEAIKNVTLSLPLVFDAEILTVRPDGVAVAGCSVFYSSDAVASDGGMKVGVTNEAGRLTARFPGGGLFFAVESRVAASLPVSASRSPVTRYGGRSIVLVLDGGLGVLQGTVRDDRGVGIAGVTVAVKSGVCGDQKSGARVIPGVDTNEAGIFELCGLPPVDIELEARAEGYVPSSHWSMHAARAAGEPCTIVLERGASLRVDCINQLGDAVTDASITARWSRPMPGVVQRDGAGWLVLPFARTPFVVEAVHVVHGAGVVTVADPSVRSVSIELSGPVIVKGRVRRADGSPIAGANVLVCGVAKMQNGDGRERVEWSCLTSETGEFAFRRVPSKWDWLRVVDRTANGGELEVARVGAAAFSATDGTITASEIGALGSVAGMLQSSGSIPIDDAVVRVRPKDDQGARGMSKRFVGTGGTFRIEDIVPGLYELQCSCSGSGGWSHPLDVLIEAGVVRDIGFMQIAQAGGLEVSWDVVGIDCHISLLRLTEGGQSAKVPTAILCRADGLARLTGIAPGKYRLEPTADQFEGQAQAGKLVGFTPLNVDIKSDAITKCHLASYMGALRRGMVTCRGKVPGGAREVLLEGYDLAGLCIWSQPCKVESGRTVRLACIIPEGCCRLVARDCIGGEKLGECDLAVAHTGPFLLDIEP